MPITSRPQAAGKSHKTVIEALYYAKSRSVNVYYIVKLGHSAGYYLAIACQVLWANQEPYEVDYNLRSVRLSNKRVLAFKEANPRVLKSVKSLNPATVFFDHAALPEL